MQQLDFHLVPLHAMLSIARWLALVLDLLVACVAVMLIALAVTLSGSSSGAQIGIALNVILATNVTVLRLVQSWTLMETSLGAVARIKNFEHDVTPEDKPEESYIPSTNWPSEGTIEFCGVTAAYK